MLSGGIQAGLLGCFLSLPHSPSHFRDSELARNNKQRQKESLTINKGGQWLGRYLRSLVITNQPASYLCVIEFGVVFWQAGPG